MKYALLIKPIGNIPYFETMKKMCVYEASIMFQAIGVEAITIDVKKVGQASYMMFELEASLNDHQLKQIASLSFYYTIFAIDENEHWHPDHNSYANFFGNDLSVRLKYNGKTNESFTRMMINVGLFSSKFHQLDKISLLDPMCGRGTTLFEGLVLGCDVYGVDQHKQSIHELHNYFSRYLKEGKYKHQMTKGKALMNGKNLGEQSHFITGDSKEALKKKSGQQLKVLCGDTRSTNQFIKKNSIHLIVTDLPYGVQHIGKDEKVSIRDLDRLLDASIKSWKQVLKSGGAMVISWNTYTNSRVTIAKALEAHGLHVVEGEAYVNFEHRVSQAINRDLIVAVKQ